MTSPHPTFDRLRPCRERVTVHPVATVEEAGAALAPAADCWGYLATPAAIRLLHRPGPEWATLLAEPRLAEARIWNPRLDLRWRDGRGVLLRVADPEAAGDGSPGETLGGDGWWLRDRRSRLWGEWLEATGLWYEERIPDPIAYPGLEPGPENRNPFLRYREYVHGGVVAHLRFVKLEGGPR